MLQAIPQEEAQGQGYGKLLPITPRSTAALLRQAIAEAKEEKEQQGTPAALPAALRSLRLVRDRSMHVDFQFMIF